MRLYLTVVQGQEPPARVAALLLLAQLSPDVEPSEQTAVVLDEVNLAVSAATYQLREMGGLAFASLLPLTHVLLAVERLLTDLPQSPSEGTSVVTVVLF